jgi:ribosomal protein S12 methylthiotransferase RimO
MNRTAAPTVWLTTLGCAKNQVDSEKVTAMLAEAGYSAAASPEEADVVMVNTCAFIDAARRESVETILELEDTMAPDARMVVLGCMAQRFGTDVAEALPEVDAILGLDRYGELPATLAELTGWQSLSLQPTKRQGSAFDILHSINRPVQTLPFAYVKTAEGCDKTCAFCAIPLIRGKQRSRRPSEIRDEMVGLATGGVSEIVLVAQDLAAYGRDIEAPGGITDLLRFLSDVDGVERMRLLYLYPTEIRQSLIDEMAANPKIADYFDLSLQHAAGPLLRTMRRPGSTDKHLALIQRIRDAAPQAALRSSFILGFPGETEADVDELADFLEAARLDWAGFFPYSPEEGTTAVELAGAIPHDEAMARLRYVSGIQDDLTASANLEMVGDVLAVLIDQVEDGVPVGRSYREAPDIDGMITLDRGEPGQWVQAEITGSYGADLAAEVVA